MDALVVCEEWMALFFFRISLKAYEQFLRGWPGRFVVIETAHNEVFELV
jgi:hypothetical protein